MDIDINAPNTNNSLWQTFDVQCPVYDEEQLASLLRNASNYIQSVENEPENFKPNPCTTEIQKVTENKEETVDQTEFILNETCAKKNTKSHLLTSQTTASIHNRRHKASENVTKPANHDQLTLTIPHSPSLSTNLRNHVHQKQLSTEERELLEIENMKQKLHAAISRNQDNHNRIKEYSVKPMVKHSAKELTVPESPCSHLVARLGHKTTISSSTSTSDDASTGSYKKPLTLTIPKSPVLHTKARSSSRPRSTSRNASDGPMTSEDKIVLEMKAYSFKALPLDTSVMSGSARAQSPLPSSRSLTVPQSPQFRTNSRLRGVKVTDSNSASQGNVDSADSSSRRPSSCPRQRNLSTTVPVEFHFATNDRTRVGDADKQQQIEIEKQNAVNTSFKASPMPDFSRSSSTAIQAQPLTQIREFSLASSRLHERSRAQMQQQAQLDEENRQKASQFIAMPLPKDVIFNVTHDPTTTCPDFDEFSLRSSQRALDRKDFDEKDKERRESENAVKHVRVAMEEEAENRELNVLRRTSVDEGGFQFKAHPVQTRDAYPSKHVETIQLTQPVSPMLLTKIRGLARGAENLAKAPKYQL